MAKIVRLRPLQNEEIVKRVIKGHADVLDPSDGQPYIRATYEVTFQADSRIDERILIAKALRAEADTLEEAAAKGVPIDATP